MLSRALGATVLVTGVHGFVGARLARCLGGTACRVHTLGRRPPDETIASDRHWIVDLQRPADITAAVKAIAPDYVFHAATCRVEENWRMLADVNITALCTLVEACHDAGVNRLVSFGASLELLGTPTSHYAASRMAGAAMALEIARQAGLAVTHIRPGYVYGSGMKSTGLLPMAIHAGLTGSELSVAPDHVVRNYVHIDDVIAAGLSALDDIDPIRRVDLLAAQSHSARAVADCIGARLGVQIATRVDPSLVRPWDLVDWAKLAGRQGGQSAPTRLAEGLGELMAAGDEA